MNGAEFRDTNGNLIKSALSRSLSLDFNLGLGYTRSAYDSFGMTDGVRIHKQQDGIKNFWGPTQAGISLVWTIGNNK